MRHFVVLLVLVLLLAMQSSAKKIGPPPGKDVEGRSDYIRGSNMISSNHHNFRKHKQNQGDQKRSDQHQPV
ncbi:unnamed protein product [Caenorhabditis auriculariae]|uniref:Uncharacterized protein n=1 Tax=Caenorhabditis auriculariae TaxID=2777116 RepID=A0A8S1H151_9PELO|nr:unnamed protein product [Caenorhabditis auriculariae]